MRSISIIFCALASLPVVHVQPNVDAIMFDFLLFIGQDTLHSGLMNLEAYIAEQQAAAPQLSHFNAAQFATACQQLRAIQVNHQNNPGVNMRIIACANVVLPGIGQIEPPPVQAVQADQLWVFIALGDLGDYLKGRANYPQRFHVGYAPIVTDYICRVVDQRTVDSMLHACDHTTFPTDWPSDDGCKWMRLLYKNSPIPLHDLLTDLGEKIKQVDPHTEGAFVHNYFSNILLKREHENYIYTFCTGPNVSGNPQSDAARACEKILNLRLTLGSGSN